MGSRMVLYLLKLVLSRILPFLEKKSRGASPSNPCIISLPMPHTTSEVIIHGSKLRTRHCVRRHAPGEPPGRQILQRNAILLQVHMLNTPDKLKAFVDNLPSAAL